MSMDAQTTRAAGEIWALTLTVYAGEGVATACIGLQDRHGVGVSVLLALMGLAALDYPLPAAQAMDTVLDRAEAWQRRVIEPLRASRRALPDAAPAALAVPAQTVRRALLAQEIETERLQQQLLVADVMKAGAIPPRPPGRDRASQAAEPVARRYLARFVEVWTENEERALRTLLAALADAAPSPG